MKVKAEDLKAGQLIRHKGYDIGIAKKLVRFYKNGRKKIEITGFLDWGGVISPSDKVQLTFKVDTLIDVIDGK